MAYVSGVHPRDGGPYSLYCFDCHCWVPNTANAEMRKEDCYAYTHNCYHGICDMKNGEKTDVSRKQNK
jgi:hypothetical protein